MGAFKVTDSVFCVGAKDPDRRLFEGQYSVPEGMAYNSYVIVDEKVAVTDTVDAELGEEWMENIVSVLGERAPDYLVIHHMEPDHSANIRRFTAAYPNCTVVAGARAFPMMAQFYGDDHASGRLEVGDGSRLVLGRHVLNFISAPMVHWPEVVLSYEESERILFSADAFGRFGASGGAALEEWTDEARRYYIGIVGKYGAQVQALLKKASALDIDIICPLHGPVLCGDTERYIGLYDTWSSYAPETRGVLIACASIYGNTAKAAAILEEKLKKAGCETTLVDLTCEDMAQAVALAFKYDRLVLASVTYNGDIFPCMRTYLDALGERGYKKRSVGLIENGSWAPVAAKKMRAELESCAEIEWLGSVTVRSALSDASQKELDALADALLGCGK